MYKFDFDCGMRGFVRRAAVAAIAVSAVVFDCFGRETAPEERPSLGEAAQWIRENVRFPEDAAEYGTAGVERFVVSAAWDGRVFISSPLQGLNPAFERAVKETVARAPRCRFAGDSPEDIYESVELDFASMIPQADRAGFVDAGAHTFPVFSGAEARDDSRSKFVEWLSERYVKSRAAAACDVADTVTVVYTIAPSGELTGGVVSDCGDSHLCTVLERLMRRSPDWTPAMTKHCEPVAVTVSDRVVVRTDAAGAKLPLELVRDVVCRNSSESVADTEQIVMNPEVKPRLLGGPAGLRGVIASNAGFDAKTEYVCSFVVERDGSVGELRVETADGRMERAIADVVRETRWSPAMQGGVPVRSFCRLHERRGPQRGTELVYAPFDSNPRFMAEERRAPFAGNEESQRRRWRRFKSAYPEAAATIHGYGGFRRLDNLGYMEAMAVRNALQSEPKRVKER